MRILFVDHSYHEKTRSSDFFKSLLSRHFKVRTLFVNPDDPAVFLKSLRVGEDELVILWQMDYLAPIFIALGLRVVVIPMYDGSSSLPDIHWLWLRQARFINFSRRLHAKIEECGNTSMLVRYYKEPVKESKLKNFDKLRVMLWQRRPEHGINLGLVERMLGGQIESIHVHDSLDDESVDSSPYLKRSRDDYELTVTNWFKSPDEYSRLLDSCNVFIAPRRSEGIGMSFIEAMARGFLVFAADGATHDEYILNWVNGILFAPENAGYTDLHGMAGKLGRMGWKSAQVGYEEWLACQPKLIEFVRSTPKAVVQSAVDPMDFAMGLIAHYKAGLHQYKNFLMRNLSILQGISPDTKAVQKVGTDGNMSLSVDESLTAAEKARLSGSSRAPWLDQNRMVAANNGITKHVIDGRVSVNQDCAWLADDGVTLGFALDAEQGVTNTMRIEYRAVNGGAAETRYVLILNGWSIGMGTLGDEAGEVVHALPAHALRFANTLRIQTLREGATDSGVAGMSWGIRRIEFS